MELNNAMSSHNLRVHVPTDLCPSMVMAARVAGGAWDTCDTLDPIPVLSLPAIPLRLDPSAAATQSQLPLRRCECSITVRHYRIYSRWGRVLHCTKQRNIDIICFLINIIFVNFKICGSKNPSPNTPKTDVLF